MVPRKESDNFPVTEHKDMEYCELTDKEFKIAIMKKFSKLQENSERQFNEPRNKINEKGALPNRSKL